MDRRVDDVLHAVDDHRRERAGDVEDALHAQHLFPVGVEQHGQPDAEGGPVERAVEAEGEGVDVLVVAGDVVPVGVVLSRSLLGLVREPAAHLGSLGAGIVDVGAQHARHVHLAVDGRNLVRRAVNTRQSTAEPGEGVGVGDVGLGEHDPVGDRRLLDRFRVAVELPEPVHAIHRRDHRAQPVVVLQHRVRAECEEDRRRVREPRGLDDQPPVRRDLAPGAPAVETDDRVLEVAANGAAEAAALQQHSALVHRLDQKVVKADGAELVDQHCGVGEGRMAQHVVEQCRLAAAEESGDDDDGGEPRVGDHRPYARCRGGLDPAGDAFSSCATRVGSSGSGARPTNPSTASQSPGRSVAISVAPPLGLCTT